MRYGLVGSEMFIRDRDELSKIKGKIDGSTGLLPVLRGIYHIRIEYPDSKAN